MQQRNLPALAAPSLPGGSAVDTWRLYSFVTLRGGYAAMSKKHWGAATMVCVSVPPRASRPEPDCVRLIYEIYVLPFELIQEPPFSEAGKRRHEATLAALEANSADSDAESDGGWGDEEEEEEEEEERRRGSVESIATSRAPSPGAALSPRPREAPKALLSGPFLAACLARATAGEPLARLASLRLVCRGWRAAIDGAGPEVYGRLDFGKLTVPRGPAPYVLAALHRGALGGSGAAAYGLAFATALGWCGARRDLAVAAAVAKRAEALGYAQAASLPALFARLA